MRQRLVFAGIQQPRNFQMDFKKSRLIPGYLQRVALYSAYQQRVGDIISVAAAKISVSSRHAKRAWLEPWLIQQNYSKHHRQKHRTKSFNNRSFVTVLDNFTLRHCNLAESKNITLFSFCFFRRDLRSWGPIISADRVIPRNGSGNRRVIIFVFLPGTTWKKKHFRTVKR